MNLRRTALAAALALVASLALAGPASADRGSAPDGTWVTCNEEAGSAPPIYIMAGGAPIWIHSPADMGGTAQAATPINCTTDGVPSPAPPRWSPADGTLVKGYNSTQVYRVVGGAPLPVSSYSGSPAVVDDASLPVPGAPDQTVTDTSPSAVLYGYFSSTVRSAFFVGPGGTAYHVDSFGHPLPVPTAPAGAPAVEQPVIDGCVRMDCDPWGDITATVVGEGQIRVYGYALDGMTSQSLTVHIEAAGRSYDIPANQPDASINAGYGITGNYGFDRVISVPAGHYDLCTTFVGFAPGATTSPAGCQVVDVPGAKPDRVARPKVKAKGHGKVLVRWKAPNAHGSAISTYVVRPEPGKKRQVSGTTTRLMFKHLHPGTPFTVRVQALNGAGVGKDSKKSKVVRIR